MSKRSLECEDLKVILRRQLNGLKVNCDRQKSVLKNNFTVIICCKIE